MSYTGQKDTSNGVVSFENFTNTIATLQSLIITPTANDFVYVNSLGQTIDSGISLSVDQTFANPSNLQVASTLAVKTYVQANITGLFKVQGDWNAAINDPTLTAGIGTDGYAWICKVAGTQTVPSGVSTDYKVGDTVYYAGGIWNQIAAGNSVSSVNGQTGAVSLASTNLTDISSTTATDAQALVYNSGSSNYTPVSFSGGLTINNIGVVTLSNTAVTGQVLTGLSTVLNLSAPVATDTILQAMGKLASTSSTAYNVTHQTASYQFLINNIMVIMDTEAQNGILPDAATVVPGVAYTLKLGGGAGITTGTLAVPTGQTLDDVVDGTYTIIGVSNGISAQSDGTGWYLV